MPPHNDTPNYSEYWWEDMPEKAHRAAMILGYTKETWDEDATIPYDSKPFTECSYQEKNAAMYLHMSPIVKKLDIWWEDTDEETKAHARTLGWDQHKWDDDWNIEDLPCEQWNWKDMTEEQQTAGKHFGYNRGTWDYVDDEEEDFEPPTAGSKPPAAASKPSSAASKPHVAAAAAAPKPATTQTTNNTHQADSTSTNATFKISDSYGSDGGDEFDHGKHGSIEEMIIYADKHRVNGLKMVYDGDVVMKSGGTGGDEHKFQFPAGEYITAIKVRHNKFVQCLTFTTNKGRTLGPCGGKGWLLPGKDKPGTETDVVVPSGYRLCGIKGRSGNAVDQIAFRWGPEQ